MVPGVSTGPLYTLEKHAATGGAGVSPTPKTRREAAAALPSNAERQLRDGTGFWRKLVLFLPKVSPLPFSLEKSRKGLSTSRQGSDPQQVSCTQTGHPSTKP